MNHEGVDVAFTGAPGWARRWSLGGGDLSAPDPPRGPDVPVQIAHLASPGHLDPKSDSALAVLASAVAAKDPRVRNLWFDIATSVPRSTSRAGAQLAARRLRQIGFSRILYGTDTASEDNLPPRDAWATIGLLVPLARAELDTIARNVPPYAR